MTCIFTPWLRIGRRPGSASKGRDHAPLVPFAGGDYSRRPRLHTYHPLFLGLGIAFDFLETPDTAFLLTGHPAYDGDLLGDLTDRILIVNIDVTVTPGTEFTYYGEPDGCSEPADVRYYFETNTSGAFEETDYWWSLGSPELDFLNGPGAVLFIQPMSAPQFWVDAEGHPGNIDAAHELAFNAAVRDVRTIGLSFGGGCQYGNGVGIQPGTGSGYFKLNAFVAQAP